MRKRRIIITIMLGVFCLGLLYLGGASPITMFKDLGNFIFKKEESKPASAVGKTDETQIESSYSFESFIAELPEYLGETYIVVNNGVPFFSEEEKGLIEPFESYSELDELGRCKKAIALVSKEGTMPENNDRTDISGITPSGWKTINTKTKFNVILPDDSFYLFNRCHLLANCLCASSEYKQINNSKVNLITGTRQMNLVMKEYEETVAKYCETTGRSVLVRATPIFVGDELLARGVLYEGYTSGHENGLEFCIYFFNAQEGFSINYADSSVKYVNY